MDFLDTIYGSHSTIKTYKSLFNKNILPYIPEAKAQTFSSNDLYNLMRRWKKFHPRTVKMLLYLVEKYVKFHNGNIDTKRIKSSVVRQIPLDKVKALTLDELNKLLVYCETKDYKLYEVILTAAYTGMRKGEIFGLEYRDIGWLSKRINIQRSYNTPYTKGRTTRVVQFPEKMLEMLKKRNSVFVEETTKVFPAFDPNERLKKICEGAGVPVITIHALRHTFATLALEAKNSPKQVQAALGHKSLKTTLDTYWNVTSEILDVNFL